MKKIEFFRHNLTRQDIRLCENVLRSLFLTTGEYVKEFETLFAEYLEKPYAVGLTSCTDALFLSLKCLGIKPEDEVITTPMSFIASSNAIEYCGAKPIFVDVEEATGNIDADKIEHAISKKTKAILVTHLYGHMCDMKKIGKLAKKYKLKIIEDCAHCIEGQRDGIRPGDIGDIACFSFYATKNVTSGEGGAIVCRDKRIYEWMLKARQHGMGKNAAERYTKKYEHYDMEFLGYKANMNNIQAALLTHQLQRIDTLWKKKVIVAKKYTKEFKKNKNIALPKLLPNTKHAWHLYTIWVSPQKRDKILHDLQNAGIGVAVNFRPIHLMKYYKEKYGYKKNMLPIAERIGASTITLPFYQKLTPAEITRVIRAVDLLSVQN